MKVRGIPLARTPGQPGSGQAVPRARVPRPVPGERGETGSRLPAARKKLALLPRDFLALH